MENKQTKNKKKHTNFYPSWIRESLLTWTSGQLHLVACVTFSAWITFVYVFNINSQESILLWLVFQMSWTSVFLRDEILCQPDQKHQQTLRATAFFQSVIQRETFGFPKVSKHFGLVGSLFQEKQNALELDVDTNYSP